jgi:hypothetical protein
MNILLGRRKDSSRSTIINQKGWERKKGLKFGMKKETKIIILRNFVVGRLTGVFGDELSLGRVKMAVWVEFDEES